MKTFAFRSALALCGLGALLAAAVSPVAAHLPDPPSMAPVDTIPVTIDKQPASLGSPPPTVLAAAAADVCNNAQLQSYRTVPMPVGYDVTACGTVLSASAAVPGRPASFALSLDTDGDALPIVVQGNAGMTVQPGQSVVVKGRYFREKTTAEGIDIARGGSVAPYSPPPSPSVTVTSSPSSLPTLPPANATPRARPVGTPMAPQPAPSPHPAPSLLPH